MKKQITNILIAATLLSPALLTGCKNDELKALNSVEKDRFIVKTEKSAIRDLEETILIVGSVKAKDEATLYPRVAGKLRRNILKEGDSVEKDQTVATIERDEVGVKFEPAPVPSTLNGIVGRIYQDVGANVTPQTPIALIVDQKEVKVKVDIPERYVSRIKTGQTAHLKVEAFPDKVFTGKIYKISPVIDSASRSAPIEILADNPKNQLQSGMFAKVEIVVGKKSDAISVSAGSIVEDEDGKAFLFVPQNGMAAKRSVKIGVRTLDYVEIAQGLKSGDEIINSGLYGLDNGSKIKINNN